MCIYIYIYIYKQTTKRKRAGRSRRSRTPWPWRPPAGAPPGPEAFGASRLSYLRVSLFSFFFLCFCSPWCLFVSLLFVCKFLFFFGGLRGAPLPVWRPRSCRPPGSPLADEHWRLDLLLCSNRSPMCMWGVLGIYWNKTILRHKLPISNLRRWRPPGSPLAPP